MKSTVFIATSLDGFIARPDGGIDWLTSIESAGEGEDYGFAEFMKRVDFLVMGRNTFDLVRGFDPWPYGETRVVVLSSRQVEIPEQLSGTVESMSASPEDIARILKERGASQLYIDGGKTIQGFLEKGLIDEMIITRIPILIGSGIPLFGELSHDLPVRHIETRQYSNGLVQSHYEVAADN